MRKALIFISLGLLLVGVSPAQTQDTGLPAVVVPNTQTIDLTSTTNGHEYQILVALPDSYNASERAYPTLYVLDPHIAFLTVTETTRLLAWAHELPEIIVVGIGYPTADINEVFPLRERDYHHTRGRDAFITFISDELFPLIESTYRADSTDRGLIGFSYGGEFVFHTLITQPEMFNRYITIDAAMGSIANELVPVFMSHDEDFARGLAGRDVRLFISSVGDEVISTALQARDYEGLTITGLSLGNVTHAATAHLSIPAAIMAIYAE
jgi:enterochelin esterase-like enzyme